MAYRIGNVPWKAMINPSTLTAMIAMGTVHNGFH
jgi:hypothetical protein